MRWVRAKDGALFGVCKGLARALDVPIGMFRLLWLISVLFLGAGIGLYLLLAFCLPREDKAAEAEKARVLGVCARIARRTNMEVGIARVLALCLLFLSLGSTLVGYIVLYFILDETPATSVSNSPTPPTAAT